MRRCSSHLADGAAVGRHNPRLPLQRASLRRTSASCIAPTMPVSSMAEPATTPTPTSSVKLSDSMCAPQYAASLKCLDEANYDKSKCQEFFDAYKECKKQERELRLEANRKSKRFF